MTRNTLLKILNLLLGLLMLNQVLTGFFHGSFSHEAYELLHEGGGVALAVVTVLHLIMNWNWIKISYFGGGAGSRRN